MKLTLILSLIANVMFALALVASSTAASRLDQALQNLNAIHDKQLLTCYMGGYLWGKYETIGSPVPPDLADARDSMQRNCKAPPL